MNILVFSWRDPKHPLAGGAEQVMHEHMKGWISSGHMVTLFASYTPGLKTEEKIDGVRIIRMGYQYWGVQLAGFLYYLKHKEEFDFIVDQFHGLPFFTPLYVRKPKLAVIQETARKVWFLNPLPRPINWLIGIIGYLGEPFIFLIYRNMPFMTGSDSAKKDVEKMGISSNHIAVVPHGVIVKNPPTSIKKEPKPTIIFLGVLSRDKGIEDALKCFKLLSQGRDFNFWVVGKPETEEYGKKIEKITSALGMMGKVKFWGFVSQEKKFELLKRSHILVNPSVREGWGLVNIEANSMGTPVVAYVSAGLTDSVKNGLNGVLCSKNTPENLTEDILRIISNDSELKKLQEGAVKWSRKFSWDNSVEQSLLLIEGRR